MYLFLILAMVVSWLIQWRLRSKFSEYAKIGLQSGLSGKQIAELMLADHGITDVRVISAEGRLTDHYNPADKTVNLSEAVYEERSAAAAAVAAHECGHAVQHATAYSMLQFRSAMVPALSAVSRFMPFILIAGVFMINRSLIPLGVGIALFSLTTLFSFVTLPVEFDASKRALAWIDKRGIVTTTEHAMAKDALWWAAMTYVVAALSSLATLLYYVSIFMGGRSRN
ncbi:peptidase membrane zinc metallopeptidase putative [Hymenobacter roseosalivarius DSM 11622]|uniref:Peptidase membrane zinc metallopeptidase putative n=1 Tax=Hymenobacter roseosalivarius DSM 11622 TaxID=645990 RepID=A0A1W1UND4_9BACT|nr:zinc metallopeptidase [Hymenobacter roseosalivarius]SMB82224.1 peptidase membrane zinc metallopeptidase putative [Hymenobacter roseosalivarius DSM 11622]